jgi:hypothetical protein
MAARAQLEQMRRALPPGAIPPGAIPPGAMPPGVMPQAEEPQQPPRATGPYL